MKNLGKKALSFKQYPFLKELGLSEVNNGCSYGGVWKGNGEELISYNPHNNEPLAVIKTSSLEDYDSAINAMESEKKRWMDTPMPVRGELVR